MEMDKFRDDCEGVCARLSRKRSASSAFDGDGTVDDERDELVKRYIAMYSMLQNACSQNADKLFALIEKVGDEFGLSNELHEMHCIAGRYFDLFEGDVIDKLQELEPLDVKAANISAENGGRGQNPKSDVLDLWQVRGMLRANMMNNTSTCSWDTRFSHGQQNFCNDTLDVAVRQLSLALREAMRTALWEFSAKANDCLKSTPDNDQLKRLCRKLRIDTNQIAHNHHASVMQLSHNISCGHEERRTNTESVFSNISQITKNAIAKFLSGFCRFTSDIAMHEAKCGTDDSPYKEACYVKELYDTLRELSTAFAKDVVLMYLQFLQNVKNVYHDKHLLLTKGKQYNLRSRRLRSQYHDAADTGSHDHMLEDEEVMCAIEGLDDMARTWLKNKPGEPCKVMGLSEYRAAFSAVRDLFPNME